MKIQIKTWNPELDEEVICEYSIDNRSDKNDYVIHSYDFGGIHQTGIAKTRQEAFSKIMENIEKRGLQIED